MAITSEEEWAERAAAFLKHKLRESEVTYAELAKRLKKHRLQGNRSLDHEQAGARDVPGHVLSGLPCGPGIGRRSIGGNLTN